MGWQEAKTRQLLNTLRENTSTKQNTSTTQSGQEQNHVNYAKHVNYGKWPEAKTHQLRFLNFQKMTLKQRKQEGMALI